MFKLFLFMGIFCLHQIYALSENNINSTSSSNSTKSSNKKEVAPNIIIVLADDLGYGDLSSWGHPTSKTPFIDKLGRKSRVLTQFYVTSPICSPSR